MAITEAPRLSVVIPCSRPTVIAKCLRAFGQQMGQHPFEVIVVGDVEGITPTYPGFDLKLIDCQESHTNVRRNLGVDHASAELIAFMDDDAAPEEDWVTTALTLNPEDRKIITGPETPVASGQAADLVFAVSQNWIAEGMPGHVNTQKTAISWNQVPFCNCVVPKKVFDIVGMPAVDIPWDVDDFEFCFRARNAVCFENNPALAIRHDRYPDSIKRFLNYKWHLRMRTGEKLLSHPYLYARIPAVAGLALLPWVMAAVVVYLSFFSLAWVATASAAGVGGYMVLLGSQTLAAIRWRGARSVVPYLGLIVALHIVTAVGIQVGLLRGALRRTRPQGARAGA